MDIERAIANHVINVEEPDDVAPPVHPTEWEGPGWYVREDDGTTTHFDSEEEAIEFAQEAIDLGAISTEECV